jgi:hypothetical protein
MKQEKDIGRVFWELANKGSSEMEDPSSDDQIDIVNAFELMIEKYAKEDPSLYISDTSDLYAEEVEGDTGDVTLGSISIEMEEVVKTLNSSNIDKDIFRKVLKLQVLLRNMISVLGTYQADTAKKIQVMDTNLLHVKYIAWILLVIAVSILV